MIISEKQVNDLMIFVLDYITTLKQLQADEIGLSKSGEKNIKNAVKLLNNIYGQQSQELRVVE